MELAFYHPSDYPALERYQLADQTFSSHPSQAVAVPGDRYPVMVIQDRQIVTFLVLDAGQDKEIYGGQPDSLLLRSFSTDDRFRQRGYAKQTLALLPDFLRAQLPQYKSLVLGVNERNQVASRLYREAGFVKQPQRIQGPAGWQEVYAKDL